MNTETKTIEGKTFVDVRTPDEFAQGHVPGAINIPLDEIPHRLQEVSNLQKPVVTYCRSGNRSSLAAAMLKQARISEVYNGGALEDVLQKAQ